MDNTPLADALQPFDDLNPDRVLHAVESCGFTCDGRLLALNSYENRVYQVGLEDADPLVAKFYRPGRWSDAQIREEHAYALELAESEVPMVAPCVIDGKTLFHFEDFRFSLSPRCGGRAVELDRDETLTWLGRFLGRLHLVGRGGKFQERPSLSVQAMGRDSVTTLVEGQWLPPHLGSAFESLCQDLLGMIEQRFADLTYREIRLHGDFHAGNILWRDGPFFVDLDDCMAGPAIQDLWLLLSGDADEQQRQLDIVIEGYRMFMPFESAELTLVEPLRTLRMLQHAAWIARRWQDPAFPRAFTWFDSTRYWEDLVLGLREQMARLQEPPISLSPAW